MVKLKNHIWIIVYHKWIVNKICKHANTQYTDDENADDVQGHKQRQKKHQ